MSSYTSPYAPSPPSPPPAETPAEIPAPEGETALRTGGFLGAPKYAEGEVNAGEPFSLEDVRVKDEEDDGSLLSAYAEPSQGGYKLPYNHGFDLPFVAPAAHDIVPRPTPLLVANLQASACLVEYPIGSKAYYILECLPCHKAFDSVAGVLVHLRTTPAHEKVKEVVSLDEAVEICGCRVVDATDEDLARRGRVVVGYPRPN
ncbi:hypothetical protein IFR05_003249 [Cadophora sp. M221]|nr:hypothetical protein IFR05_003249 [Cadophora sp. M221]